MSDKFLNTGGSGGADISNGSINAYLASLTVASLRPSMPLKTNSVNTLVSTKLDINDINNLESRLDAGGGVSNPYVGTFKATDLETDDYFSVNDELQKIDNIQASTQAPDITNITGLTKSTELATDRIYDTSQAVFIDLDGTDVAISATNLTFNGNAILTDTTTDFVKTDGTSIMTGPLNLHADSFDNVISIIDTTNTTQANSYGIVDFQGAVGGLNMRIGCQNEGFARVSSYSTTNDLVLSTNTTTSEKRITLKASGILEVNNGNLDMKTNDIVNAGNIDITNEYKINGVPIPVLITEDTAAPTNCTFGGKSVGNIGTATGAGNTSFGQSTLASLTNGSGNTAVGTLTGNGLTSGSLNTCVGSLSGYLMNTAAYNTCIGFRAGGNITSSTENTLVGIEAGYALTETGVENVAVGNYALSNGTTSKKNTSLGHNSMYTNLTGDNNSIVGETGLYDLTTGDFNSAFGSVSGSVLTIGSNNLFLGANTSVDNSNAQNRLVLGNNAQGVTDNTCMIGNNLMTAIMPNATATCSLGTATNNFSDIYLSGSIISVATTYDLQAEGVQHLKDTTSITGLTGNDKWYGGVLGGNGKIYGVPSLSGNVLIIDPSTDTAEQTSITGLGGGVDKWYGGVLAPNGKIYCVPYNSTTVLIIDPSTDTAEQTSITGLSGSGKWVGGVLAPNGKIYCIPNDSENVLIIDPSTDTAEETSITGLTGTIKWMGGVLGGNGKIYCVPRNSNNVLIIDPSTDTAEQTSITGFAGTSKWTGGVLATNGKIYCIPRTSSTVLIIDPSNDTAEQSSITGLTGSNKWHGATLLRDGKIYCSPRNASTVLVIDPSNDTVEEASISGLGTDTAKWFGSVVAPNGKLYFIPADSSHVLIIDPVFVPSFPIGRCISAYYNKL